MNWPDNVTIETSFGGSDKVYRMQFPSLNADFLGIYEIGGEYRVTHLSTGRRLETCTYEDVDNAWEVCVFLDALEVWEEFEESGELGVEAQAEVARNIAAIHNFIKPLDYSTKPRVRRYGADL